jgi:GT2 family glycosyltransferase
LEIKVSIIIVNFNSQKTIGRCIDALYSHVSGIAHEIIVVDNASSPESVRFIKENYPHIRLIVNAENKGFGTANNMGVRHASGDYLFFLNPDAILLDNAVLRFYRFFEEEKPEAASCGGNLVKENGESTTAYGNFFLYYEETNLYYRLHRVGRARKREAISLITSSLTKEIASSPRLLANPMLIAMTNSSYPVTPVYARLCEPRGG